MLAVLAMRAKKNKELLMNGRGAERLCATHWSWRDCCARRSSSINDVTVATRSGTDYVTIIRRGRRVT